MKGYFIYISAKRRGGTATLKENRPINILLIDDSELDLMIMYDTFRFTHQNYVITPFSNHTDAIEYLKKDEIAIPDIIIIDAKTLHMCKDSFLNFIDLDIRLSRIPIVILTSVEDEEICFSGLKLPNDSFIEKPFSLADQTEFSNRIEEFWLSRNLFKNRLN